MNQLILWDIFNKIKEIPDKSIDLIITDPPYKIVAGGAGWCFWVEKEKYHLEVSKNDMLNCGIDNSILNEFMRVMRKPNIYLWCNKNQLRQYLDFFEDAKCAVDVLVWCKTNPIPTCSNKYLSDIEYIVFARAKGVKVYWSYSTKHKYYVSQLNTADKKKRKHPTIKPLNIIQNLIINSSVEWDTVLDPYMWSWTTWVACKLLNRSFIWVEINEDYFNIADTRINKELQFNL